MRLLNNCIKSTLILYSNNNTQRRWFLRAVADLWSVIIATPTLFSAAVGKRGKKREVLSNSFNPSSTKLGIANDCCPVSSLHLTHAFVHSFNTTTRTSKYKLATYNSNCFHHHTYIILHLKKITFATTHKSNAHHHIPRRRRAIQLQSPIRLRDFLLLLHIYPIKPHTPHYSLENSKTPWSSFVWCMCVHRDNQRSYRNRIKICTTSRW